MVMTEMHLKNTKSPLSYKCNENNVNLYMINVVPGPGSLQHNYDSDASLCLEKSPWNNSFLVSV